MSAKSILKRKSVKRLKAELKALETELSTCNGCAVLKCEVRGNCPDNELNGKVTRSHDRAAF